MTYTIDGNFIELRNADDAIAVHMVRELEVELPEPDPGVPTGRVTAPNGVNIRSGPGTNFPVLAVAPFGTTGEIIGRSADARWWVVAVPSAPGGNGWVSADFVAASNAADVPVIAAPPSSALPMARVVSPPTPLSRAASLGVALRVSSPLDCCMAERVGWVTPRRAAARVKLPSTATAWKARS